MLHRNGWRSFEGLNSRLMCVDSDSRAKIDSFEAQQEGWLSLVEGARFEIECRATYRVV